MHGRVADRGRDGVCVVRECILISVNFTAELTQLSVFGFTARSDAVTQPKINTHTHTQDGGCL